jgi:eukaryotic-like serine/threonine-protein kinase
MKTLGKYEVLAELATGSMGVIYRGRDTMLDREVALKTIAGTGNLDPELKERFYREARAGAKLHHPNVITVYELGDQDGLVFIALELLSGSDLRHFIAERRQLPAEQKAGIVAAVCDGLHHAHQHGIVHRDIKPSNVFLTDRNVPKILDFGVARLSASKLTVVGRVLGTPFYMAPEQIMGQPCDERSDLFSLAIVGFELLTFCHPFAGSIPKRILNEPPDSLVARDPELPPALEPVFVKALAKDPAQRYQTVEEFGQALREAAREGWGSPATAATRPPVPRATPDPADAPAPAAPATPEPAIPQFANTEYKMSAILFALQQFDEAMDGRNAAQARTALATVEALAKVDDRFATAARESRTRLQELEASLPPEPEPAPPAPVYTPPPIVETPGPAPVPPAPAPRTTPPPVQTMLAAPPVPAPEPEVSAAPAAPVDDATSMFGVPPSLRRKAPPVAPPEHRPTVIPTPPAPVPPRTPAPEVTPPPAAQPAAQNRTVIIVAAAGGALILIAVMVWLIARGGGSVAPAPALATARVAAAQTDIRRDPSDSADVVATLKKGDPVNVIRPPRSRSQEWTEVQYVAGKTVSRAGAMHTADLDHWSSTKPDIALYLVEMYAPGPGAGDAELREYAQKLSTFLKQFSGTPQQAEARAELDKINAALDRTAAPPPPPTRTKPLSAPSSAAPAPPPKSEPAFNADDELKRAAQAWEKGDYDQAERILKHILQQRPDLASARIMLQRVQRAKLLEGAR